jgi:hypothetical protein
MLRLTRCWIAACFAVALCASPASWTPASSAPPGEDPAADFGEVRLRKLHLVRPDLIPYPVAYEVYC